MYSKNPIASVWICFVGCLAIVTQQLHAEGTAFTYQGRLNEGASPASGNYDFRFRLARDQDGNDFAATVVTNGVPVENGLFMVAVDFGAGIFNGSNYWLQIEVRSNGVGSFIPLSSGLQPLMPTPYAVFANAAGTVASGGLAAGTYGNAINLSNAANQFTGVFAGNGGGLTNVNAATLGGLSSSSFWKLGGNAGANPTNGNFIGTTDNLPLELKVNSSRALRFEPNTNGAPNVIGGAAINSVSNGAVGATIAGGGVTNYFGVSYTNRVTAHFGTVSGGYNNTASGIGATVGGGARNNASGDATVGGGYGNTASGSYATVSGGDYNTASYTEATVSGGYMNTASNYGATVGGGLGNTASGPATTVGGGYFNTAGGSYATVGGGYGNTAGGSVATVPGGYNNTASGDYSFAAGRNAQALHPSSFVWADNSSANAFASTANNQFSVRASGGIRLAGNVELYNDTYRYLSLNGGNSLGYLYGSFPAFSDGVHLGYNYYADASGGGHVRNTGGGTSRITTGYGFVGIYVGGVNAAPNTQRLYADTTHIEVNGTFNNNSDRNAKQDFTAIRSADILEKVAQLPITEWSYKDDPTTRHIGPMAQDFQGTFCIGTDDKHIAPIDEGGLAFAAIQGLNEKVESGKRMAETQIEELKAENADLKQRLEKLERLMEQESK